MKRRFTGRHVSISDVGGECARAFVPAARPPASDAEFTTALRVVLLRKDS